MLHTPLPLRKTAASVSQSLLTSLDASPVQPTGATHLTTAVTIYATIEFIAVAASAYFVGLFYQRVFLGSWYTDSKYILAALLIATLVAFTSIVFRSFIAIRRQPKHIFLLKGIGSVVLAFSLFLSVIFIAKHSEEYSRATFVLQIYGVIVAVTCARALFYSWLQSAIASHKLEARRVALIGDISHCSIFSDRLKTSGIHCVGFFNLPNHRSVKEIKIRKLIAECRVLRADDIVVLATNEFMPTMFDLASSLAELPAGVHIVPVDA